MKTLLCEQAGRGSLRYLLFEDAEGGLPEALARVAEYRLAGRTPQGNSVGRTAG